MREHQLVLWHQIIIAAFSIYVRGLINVVCNGWDTVKTCSYVQEEQSRLIFLAEWRNRMTLCYKKGKNKNKVQLIRKPQAVQKSLFWQQKALSTLPGRGYWLFGTTHDFLLEMGIILEINILRIYLQVKTHAVYEQADLDIHPFPSPYLKWGRIDKRVNWPF